MKAVITQRNLDVNDLVYGLRRGRRIFRFAAIDLKFLYPLLPVRHKVTDLYIDKRRPLLLHGKCLVFTQSFSFAEFVSTNDIFITR